ncbi:MAG: hypothetical protein APF77_22080 [Clostridia bacterium BRH_c25]|nr:MAG: hypothetical protein APF77_22080 [Clostridia bacterium BRH_c25]
MFANRFTVLHPDRVLAASVGSPGGWPIAPVKMWNNQELRYPIGISDLKDLTGKEFDMETYKKVPQLFYLGDQDENDSVPYGDSYEEEDRIIINELFGSTPVKRWPESEKVYKEFGVNAVFRLYTGVKHRPTIGSVKETKALFRKAMEESRQYSE